MSGGGPAGAAVNVPALKPIDNLVSLTTLFPYHLFPLSPRGIRTFRE
ncbi:hypothetical protein D083_4439 [Dickeya solani RNS 08.23.3.1.A]|nr:hypothetical protein D083_4439 [Dickeya solani RNS 08.23.3.1.A]